MSVIRYNWVYLTYISITNISLKNLIRSLLSMIFMIIFQFVQQRTSAIKQIIN